ncbi:MAG: LPS export ABC transporter periplasmic protein LptC [Alphaproteobacteria bacterium]|nr:LPS export ABC transporter periplasmic protein LptC [Alphaproteobacteria bacterium]
MAAERDGQGGDNRNPMRSTVLYRSLHWRPKVRGTLKSARRYSVFVKFMKGALPIGALALAISVLLYALQPRETARLALTFEQLDEIEGDRTMLRPKLTGTDDDGLPFMVSAATAVQDEIAADTVRLEDVVADITLSDGTNLRVTAGKGVVDTKTRKLDISDGIRFTSAEGYDARTSSATADLRSGTVRGDNPIEADGKFGHITAERFALDRDTRQLLFSGNVRMLLNRADALVVPGIRR